MNPEADSHFQKDIEYHETIGDEYHKVVVDPRSYLNEMLFAPIAKIVKAGESMLDLGCGTGHMMLRFGQQFQSVTGVDHSPKMLGSARINCRIAGINAQFQHQNLFDFLAGNNQQYDLVSCVGCLHHLIPETIPEVMKGIARSLNSGGMAIMAEPIMVDANDEPAAIARWNQKAIGRLPQYTTAIDEPDEAPIDPDLLLGAISAAGLQIEKQSRSWEILPKNMPPSALDRLVIRFFHWRYGSNGIVMAIAASKP